MGKMEAACDFERDKWREINVMEYKLSLQKLITRIRVIGFEIIGGN